jgi:hypothetical protein
MVKQQFPFAVRYSPFAPYLPKYTSITRSFDET